jgi:hypothetical protein
MARSSARAAPTRAKVLHSGRRLPTPRLQPNRSSPNRIMQLGAPTSTTDNDADLSLTSGFLSESCASESEEDVLILLLRLVAPPLRPFALA